MFTGIVEEVGIVQVLTQNAAGAKLDVACRLVLEDTTIGGSIAVNGVCLTAVDLRPDGFSADLAPETLERSNLGDLAADAFVNLERPLSLNTRLSGHIVQGHVDGTAVLEKFAELGDGNWDLQVRVPRALERFLVYKGSICLDGISLTIASIEDDLVRVAIIPHTAQATNLSRRSVGDRINIECDILAKHVEKLVSHMQLSLT